MQLTKLPLFLFLATIFSITRDSATAIAIPMNTTTTLAVETNSTSTHFDKRGTNSVTKSLSYCGGHVEPGNVCGGPCTSWTGSLPLDGTQVPIFAPDTNCMTTDGTTDFMVCRKDLIECSTAAEFTHGKNSNGDHTWAIVNTWWIYPSVVVTGG